jgi:hypothetical protein
MSRCSKSACSSDVAGTCASVTRRSNSGPKLRVVTVLHDQLDVAETILQIEVTEDTLKPASRLRALPPPVVEDRPARSCPGMPVHGHVMRVPGPAGAPTRERGAHQRPARAIGLAYEFEQERERPPRRRSAGAAGFVGSLNACDPPLLVPCAIAPGLDNGRGVLESWRRRGQRDDDGRPPTVEGPSRHRLRHRSDRAAIVMGMV